jgi:predicted dehydrogenase
MEARVSFPSGATGELEASLFSHKLLSTWIEVRGEHGYLHARNPTVPQMGFARLNIQSKKQNRIERFYKPSTYEEQLRAFVNLVKRGVPVPTDGWDGVHNMAVIDDVYRAAGMQVRG